jgi:hypothetical protein
MKVTAFHLANKVEEAARSYFSNSFVFSSRLVDVERIVDFNAGTAALQFFVHDGEQERVPMGGIEFATVQERDHKVAFQCRYNIQPSDFSRQFFMMLPAESEPYAQYARLAELLTKQWDKDVAAYLPKHEAPPPPPPEPMSVDDEYGSLTPEEIEAITGVKPEPKSAAPAQAEEKASAQAQADEDEIARLMNMMAAGPQAAAADDPNAPMSLEQIEALAREVQQQEAPKRREPIMKPAPAKAAKEAPASQEDDLSAEQIWKQLTGGK